jgi:hypothetical protein
MIAGQLDKAGARLAAITGDQAGAHGGFLPGPASGAVRDAHQDRDDHLHPEAGDLESVRRPAKPDDGDTEWCRIWT